MSQTAAIIARMGLDSGEYRKDLQQTVKENAKAQQQMARDAEKSAKQAEAARKRLNDYIKNESAGITSALKGGLMDFAGLAGIPLGIAGVAEFGKTILDFAGNLQDSSDALGINVEALQELQGAFAQSGAGPEVVAKGLAELSMNLNAAKEGNEGMVASLKRLGVSWDDIQNLAPDEILMKIAASASEAHDPAQRLSDIVDVLGKSGLKMAAGLNAGSEALAQMRGEVSKLSAEEVAMLDNAGDALSRFGDKAKVVGAKAVLDIKQVIDVLEKIGQFTGGGQAGGNLPPGFIPTGPIAPELIANSKPKASTLSPEEAKDKAAFEKAEADKFKSIQDLREFERQQYVQWLGQKEAADRKDGESKIEFEKRQFDEFRKYQESEREKASKAEEVRISKLGAQAKQNAQSAANAINQRVDDRKNGITPGMRRRMERREGSMLRRAQREQSLENRGGRSQKDIDDAMLPPLRDRLKPRENFGPNETLPERESRLRRLRGEQAKEALARGRKGADPAADFKSALDSSTIASDIAEIKDNLKPV